MENKKTLEIKITDFGFATSFDQETKLDQVLGSPIYTAPEIVRKEKYDSKVDIWSAGIIVYFLFSGDHPFTTRINFADLS